MPRPTPSKPAATPPTRPRGAPPSPTRGMPKGASTQKGGNPFGRGGMPALPKRSQKKP